MTEQKRGLANCKNSLKRFLQCRLVALVASVKNKGKTELDNLLKISTFLRHESDDGRHPEATGGWDYYNTVFRVNGKYYEGEVSIELRNNGREFHDITKIKETDRYAGLSEKSPADWSTVSLFDNNIPQNSEDVKHSFSGEKRGRGYKLNYLYDLNHWDSDEKMKVSQGLITSIPDNRRPSSKNIIPQNSEDVKHSFENQREYDSEDVRASEITPYHEVRDTAKLPYKSFLAKSLLRILKTTPGVMGSHSAPQARFVRRLDKLQKAPDQGC